MNSGQTCGGKDVIPRRVAVQFIPKNLGVEATWIVPKKITHRFASMNGIAKKNTQTLNKLTIACLITFVTHTTRTTITIAKYSTIVNFGIMIGYTTIYAWVKYTAKKESNLRSTNCVYKELIAIIMMMSLSTIFAWKRSIACSTKWINFICALQNFPAHTMNGKKKVKEKGTLMIIV